MTTRDLPLRPLPSTGRVFAAEAVVRLGDVTPTGRVRLDAIARYLQDVAGDDARDAGWPNEIGWLVRRVSLTVVQFPAFGERLRLETFCSGAAAMWAERTTTITGHRGGLVQSVATWVAVNTATGRPTRLGELFDQVYVPSTGGHRASARLHLRGPDHPERDRPWPVRAADLDLYAHVNNAISWAAAEEVIAAVGWLPRRAELEHHREITASHSPRLLDEATTEVAELALVENGQLLTAARLERAFDR